VHEIALLMGYEVTLDLPLENVPIETPLEAMLAPHLAGTPPCLLSILRAGNGLLDGMLELLPDAAVGFIGLARDSATLQPAQYYLKLPDKLAQRLVIVLDPMLATGNSAAAAVTQIKAAGATNIRLVCLLAAPEGLAAFHTTHPDVTVYTAAIDRGLDSHGYIRPGLGDAGDRIYGTT
jgi:uracil phosphoribosyltransferase